MSIVCICTRWTLDQYNITADAVIHFTPMHKTLKIQLPDLRYPQLGATTFSPMILIIMTLSINIIEQVVSNKSSLLLKIILQNAQALQLFTKIIKKEIIYKSN
jgi:Kindlin-2 N-terminal domain